MLHNTCNEVQGCFGKTVLAVRIAENIVAVLVKEGHIRVHTRACYTEDRLRHKGCIEVVKLCVFFNDILEGHNLVGNGENVAVLEVDLVLTFGTFVVGSLDLEAHILKGNAHITAAVSAEVNVVKVEIACLVVGFGCRSALVVRVEKEELKLGTDIKLIAHIVRFFDRSLENISRIARERSSVGTVNVADQTCRLSFGQMIPRKNDERIVVGIKIHIRLLDADEAFD